MSSSGLLRTAALIVASFAAALMVAAIVVGILSNRTCGDIVACPVENASVAGNATAYGLVDPVLVVDIMTPTNGGVAAMVTTSEPNGGAVQSNVNATTSSGISITLSRKAQIAPTVSLDVLFVPSDSVTPLRLAMLDGGYGGWAVVAGQGNNLGPQWMHTIRPYPSPLNSTLLLPGNGVYMTDVTFTVDRRPMIVYADDIQDGNVYVLTGADEPGSAFHINSLALNDTAVNESTYITMTSRNDYVAICYTRHSPPETGIPIQSTDISLLVSPDGFETFKQIVLLRYAYSRPSMVVTRSGAVYIAAVGPGFEIYVLVSPTGFQGLFTTIAVIPVALSAVAVLGCFDSEEVVLFVQVHASSENFLYTSTDTFTVPENNVVTGISVAQATTSLHVQFASVPGLQQIYVTTLGDANTFSSYTHRQNNTWTTTIPYDTLDNTVPWNVATLQRSDTEVNIASCGGIDMSSAPVAIHSIGQPSTYQLEYVRGTEQS